MSCTHVDDTALKIPRTDQPVYREDCTQCFDSINDPLGLDVCLYCFNGGCSGERQHSLTHVQARKHPLVVNIKRSPKPRSVREEPPQKSKKLAITAETEADLYDTVAKAKCYECAVDDIPILGKLEVVVNAVLNATTYSHREEVKAWEQELIACQHVLTLQQGIPKSLQLQDGGNCANCHLTGNLWLCLECGNLGCGRAQFGGVGGNSHGLKHQELSNHSVAVKLGSLTADGGADIFCYDCNEERLDPEIKEHLAHWGINITDRKKTEKSQTELQVEQNLRWDFNMTTGDGRDLVPIFSPGFTGLKNLGNSCYMNSVLQLLFSIPEFQSRFYRPTEDLPPVLEPAQDLETQLRKVAEGLLSGRYALPDPDIISSYEETSIQPYQKGLGLSMLKALVGRNHTEFSTMRQQDAQEYMTHLLDLIGKLPGDADPTDIFKFVLETRLQCTNCHKVRYTTNESTGIFVPLPMRKGAEDIGILNSSNGKKDQYDAVSLEDCLDIFTAEKSIDGRLCPGCGEKSIAGFTESQKFQTFPKVLAFTCGRYALVNMFPTKIDVPVIVREGPISFEKYFSSGPSPGEETLPGNDDNANKFLPNSKVSKELQDMGFSAVRCEKALHATGNTDDTEMALNWLISYMEDPDIDIPLDLTADEVETDEHKDKINQICTCGMDFTAAQARKALKASDWDVVRATDWIFGHPDYTGEEVKIMPDSTKSLQKMGVSDPYTYFQLQSIICHKGPSIHSGHYVAFVMKPLPEENDPKWVLFNDEKVTEAVDAEEMGKFAYIYFFRRL